MLFPYITRCSFSLSSLVKVTDTGQVVYKAEKQGCRAFPNQNEYDLAKNSKETTSLLVQESEIASRLVRDFQAWNQSVEASVEGTNYPEGRVLRLRWG